MIGFLSLRFVIFLNVFVQVFYLYAVAANVSGGLWREVAALNFIGRTVLPTCTNVPAERGIATFTKPVLCSVLSTYLSSLLNTTSSTKTDLEPSTGITDIYDIATL